MTNPIKWLENKINEQPIEKRLMTRLITYSILIIPLVYLWVTTDYQNILFSISLILLIGALFFNREDVTSELQETKDEIINKMAELVEFKDEDTGYHVRRVSEYTRLLATLDGRLSYKQINNLAEASPLHDIGKIAIKDKILTKPEKLTDEERKIMDTHTTKGYKIFKDSKKDYLKLAAKIAYEHHEKWDGTGYPRGIKGEDISLEGRITAIADVFDALVHKRCYKDAMELNKAIKIIKEGRGSHFDPNLVDLFLENKNQFIAIKEKYQ